MFHSLTVLSAEYSLNKLLTNYNIYLMQILYIRFIHHVSFTERSILSLTVAMLTQIRDALRDLVSFVQRKNVKHTHGSALFLLKLQANLFKLCSANRCSLLRILNIQIILHLDNIACSCNEILLVKDILIFHKII